MERDGVTQQMLSAGDIYVNGLKKIYVRDIPLGQVPSQIRFLLFLKKQGVVVFVETNQFQQGYIPYQFM